jgi:hypothetical protein
MILQSLIQPKATYQKQKIALKLVFLVDMKSVRFQKISNMAIYAKRIDLLLEYIDKPAASYILSSFISTIRDSFPFANTVITLLLCVLLFSALISSSDKIFSLLCA